jgi:hypothetical protein
MQITTTPADKWFSRCVRQRANWTCQKCNVSFEHDKGYLDCSHFISRKYKATRYHPLAALAHCKSCHQELGGGRWGGGNIAEFAAHYDSIFGEQMRESMRRLSKCSFRKHDLHIPGMSKHYQAELKSMEKGEKEDFDFYTGSLELNALAKEFGC